MDLATIEITKEEAEERLREYEGQITEERTVEDEAIKAGYRAAARGLPVVQLTKCIERGGYFPSGLPRIAIVRADAKRCHVMVEGSQPRLSFVFADARHADNRGALVGNHTVRVTVPAIPAEEIKMRAWRGETVVPIIPPRHRPGRARIRGFHILWEVEAWANIAPRDPALLRHIRGDLWSVVATWDLTDLERAVLAARA